MNSENNYENNKVSLEEQPINNNQESSGESWMPIDHSQNSVNDEIPKEFLAEEHKMEEHQSESFDPNVYYRSQQENNSAKSNHENVEEDKKASFFGLPMGSVSLPKITSKEEARKVFFGQRVTYYEKYYTKLQETKKKISWNWAAFFLNVYWFFSRKMYAYGILAMFSKAMFTLVGYNLYNNMANSNIQSLMIPWAILYMLVDVGVGMFANYLYISHMESKIVYPGESELSNDDLVKVIVMRGGFTMSGILMCFLLSDLVIYGLQYLMTLI